MNRLIEKLQWKGHPEVSHFAPSFHSKQGGILYPAGADHTQSGFNEEL